MSKHSKHSNVFYIYRKTGGQFVFEAVKKAKICKNDLGLDLFQYDNGIYEGRTGCKIMSIRELPDLESILEKMGGVNGVHSMINDLIKTTGESPRYTRPDERKKDIFPQREKDENNIFAKDSHGKKHYYSRFYNENGIELYVRKNKTDDFRRVYVNCEGYMLDIGSYQNLDTALAWLAGLENGVKCEVERAFNESMADPQKWADLGFANILGRADEAKAHNAHIREARKRENERRDAEYEAERNAQEQADKAEYEQAIKTAEAKILNRQTVQNADIQGKSLIMQLFREHKISVPLKTQGWIIKALCDICFNENRGKWCYHYYKKSKDSTVFSDYLLLLVSAVQEKQSRN
ncbi:MAG: hypothetical protein FWG87_01535 [Defluviitaleaceae bacterium]|nr:hypothetical protein [Defluviitaleaceae bacterium]